MGELPGGGVSERTEAQGQAPKRHTRSRRALIAAAQGLLAEGQTDFSIQEVAERAEVVTQTLYNHFPSRQALISAAVDDAMEQWEADMLAATGGLQDPLEQLSANMRLFGRMPDSHPRLAAIVVNAPERSLAGPRGYTPEAVKHLQGIADAGLIKPTNLDLALMSIVAATERLMALRAIDPTRPPEEADELAFQNLLVLGVPRHKVVRLVSLPLPEFPPRVSD